MGLADNTDPSTMPGGPVEVDEMMEAAPDPFSAAGAPGVQLIVQLRLYDVLMGIYTHLDPERAELLSDLHRSGAVLMSPPEFRGRFVDEEIMANKVKDGQ